ncbi:hypothetical protein [Wenjunlia tyrosinilytica]|uniref:Uncharacterized protein n=1 Tax=Wenjunlia tyrosinilytica TaxID=1544741 RepID=A0A918E0S4_9ACTN|nr:hypothetical protein [Wenjunlia tyrosinilytica]GGO98114.1 hypothetical protein GCM10012280_61490 [Wenjunlia tyrosinilytica]
MNRQDVFAHYNRTALPHDVILHVAVNGTVWIKPRYKAGVKTWGDVKKAVRDLEAQGNTVTFAVG